MSAEGPPAGSTPGGPPPDPVRPWWLSALAGTLGMAVVLHLVATAIFVSPDNPVRRAAGAPLTAYMQPLFEQNWSLFAPVPISTGYSLWVRGWDGTGQPTEWVDASAVEIDANIRHNLTPSRAGVLSRRTAGLMRAQYNDLTDGERAILGADHLDGAWAEMADQMAAAPDASSEGRRSYALRLDRAITAYATQFAWAWWGRDTGLEYVQVRIEDTRAPRFEERGSQPSYAVREFGRRPLYVYDHQDAAAFTEAIERFRS